MKYALIGLYVSALTACVASQSARSNYFPSDAFAEDGSDVEFVQDWYARALQTMKEPSLYELKDPAETYYRFLWLRSFHRPVSITLAVAVDQTATLQYKMASGQGGYEPGRLIKNQLRSVTPAQVAEFVALFELISICNPKPDEIVGSDGAEWIFEYRDRETYCAADSWWGHDEAYRDAGLYLLDLAGFAASERDPIY